MGRFEFFKDTPYATACLMRGVEARWIAVLPKGIILVWISAGTVLATFVADLIHHHLDYLCFYVNFSLPEQFGD